MPHRARFASFLLFITSLIAAWPTGTLDAQDRRGPFTAPPRSVRSRDIDQQHLTLKMNFEWDDQRIVCDAIHRLKTFKPLREIKLDAAEMQIATCKVISIEDSDTIEKRAPLKFEHRGHELTIILDKEYPAASELQLWIVYKLEKPKHGVHFVVPDESEPDQPKMVWTQCEPEYARFWYPCFDSPSDRLTSEIIATVPKQYMTLSNGVLKEKNDAEKEMQTWHWVQAKSHVPYLMSFVAGDFEALEQKWNDMPVISYVPRGRLAEAPTSFEKTPRMVEFFSQKIGLKYPWEKYAQICVDEYQWGGMEHTSATTLTLRTLHDERAHLDVSSDNLVAHELAHQWWGDLLTCKDWGELWLNESFATYFATLWAEHDLGWDEAAWDRRGEANEYLEEDARYRRPIVTYRYPGPESMFDRHTYPKGGRVLHMLRFVLGDEAYWKSIHRYAEVNQFRTVETADLRRAIEDSTGQGLNWFFDQWVHRGGHPEFDVSWQWDDASKNAVLTVKQTQKVDDLTPLFRMPVEIEIATGTATQMKRIELSKAEETFHFALDARPSRIVFDPKDWLLKKLKCDKSKEEWIDQLANCQHVVARAQAVEALKGMKDHDDVEAALIKAAKSDAFWGVREEAAKALAGLNNDAVRNALLEAAAKDPKSHVRRAAIDALGNFAHDDVRKALRTTFAEDKSYFAQAEALRSLMKIDRDKMRETLLAALDTPSHDHVILKAACDGLVDLKADETVGRLTKKLEGKLRPEERVIVISALAKLKPTDDETLAKLKAQLNNDRLPIRRAAIETIVSLNNPVAIAWLQEQRGKEEHNRTLRNIDEAIEKLRNGQKPVSEVQREVEELRKKNRELEERLKKVESKS